VKPLDELANNKALLDYIADDLVHGFVFCMQLNNRLLKDTVDYLQYLVGMLGKDFEHNVQYCMTSLTDAAFEDDYCFIDLPDDEWDQPYSCKFDESRYDGKVVVFLSFRSISHLYWFTQQWLQTLLLHWLNTILNVLLNKFTCWTHLFDVEIERNIECKMLIECVCV
jgi:hypothetical protein